MILFTPLFVLHIGGIGFGLGVGIIVGYFLGRRSRSREMQAGFPVAPLGERRDSSGNQDIRC
ncbi:MAG: hypothetical protein JWO87_2423 [Phycisphaerales bacterium]|nr:hypothetical protein [Phycisphaerales bacterium]